MRINVLRVVVIYWQWESKTTQPNKTGISVCLLALGLALWLNFWVINVCPPFSYLHGSKCYHAVGFSVISLRQLPSTWEEAQICIMLCKVVLCLIIGVSCTSWNWRAWSQIECVFCLFVFFFIFGTHAKMWLNISKWGGCWQKPFWMRLTDVQQGQKWHQMTFGTYSSR